MTCNLNNLNIDSQLHGSLGVLLFCQPYLLNATMLPPIMLCRHVRKQCCRAKPSPSNVQQQLLQPTHCRQYGVSPLTWDLLVDHLRLLRYIEGWMHQLDRLLGHQQPLGLDSRSWVLRRHLSKQLSHMRQDKLPLK